MATATTLEHRGRMDTVARAVNQQAATVLATATPGDIDAWWVAAAPQLSRFTLAGSAATARLARSYLVDHAEEANAGRIEPVTITPDPARVAQALAVTGPVAFKTNMARTGSNDAAMRAMTTRLVGTVRRLTLAGGRETTMGTIYEARQIVGYQRVARAGACDFCSMLAGRGAVFLSRERATEVGRAGRIRGNRQVGESYHDSCVVGSTVVEGPSAKLAHRRWYEGELVVISVAGSQDLAITPKHPVLTDRGWVDAGDLSDADRLVHSASRDLRPLEAPYEHQMPSLVEDVWGAGLMNELRSVPVAPKDFHGDGIGTQGYVDVVPANRLFATVSDAAPVELVTERLRPGAGATPVLDTFSGLGDLAPNLLGLGRALHSCVCGRGNGHPILGSRALVPEFAGGRVAPDFDPGFKQPPTDWSAGEPEPLRDREFRLAADVGLDYSLRRIDSAVAWPLAAGPRFDPPSLEEDPGRFRAEADLGASLLKRLAGQVQLSRPVELRRVRDWSGHVYNLRTVEGWYSANSVVVSNCGCVPEPIYE